MLYRRDPAEERPIASATKLMTALVALDELPLGREVRAVPYDPAPAESRIDLRTGERMSVADLLRALLLESANDAAETLAVRAAGSVDRFVRRMNERAREIGLRHTSFANPVGLDSPGAHSTALDLSRLARRVLRNDFLAATVDMPRARLLSGARPRILANRNRLVREVGWVDGVKTGHTAGGRLRAGRVHESQGRAARERRAGGPHGGRARRRHVERCCATGSPSTAARGLCEPARRCRRRAWSTSAVARYGWCRGDRVSVTVRRGQRLRTVVRAPEQLSGPVPAGARVGTVTVYREGRRVRSVPVVTAAGVPEAGLLRKAWSLIWSPIPVLAALGIAVWLILRRRRRILAARRGPAPAHERAGG